MMMLSHSIMESGVPQHRRFVPAHASHLLHLSPLAGREPAPDLIRGRLASGALATRSKPGEGAIPQASTRGGAPSLGFLRSALLRSESELSPQAGRGGASC